MKHSKSDFNQRRKGKENYSIQEASKKHEDTVPHPQAIPGLGGQDKCV